MTVPKKTYTRTETYYNDKYKSPSNPTGAFTRTITSESAYSITPGSTITTNAPGQTSSGSYNSNIPVPGSAVEPIKPKQEVTAPVGIYDLQKQQSRQATPFETELAKAQAEQQKQSIYIKSQDKQQVNYQAPKRDITTQESNVPPQPIYLSKGIAYKDLDTGEQQFIPDTQKENNLFITTSKKTDLPPYKPNTRFGQLEFEQAKADVNYQRNPSDFNALKFFGISVVKGGVEQITDFGIYGKSGFKLPLSETVKGTANTIFHPVKAVQSIQANPVKAIGETTGSAVVLFGATKLATKGVNMYLDSKTKYSFVGEADITTKVKNKYAVSNAEIKGLAIQKVGKNVKNVQYVEQLQSIQSRVSKSRTILNTGNKKIKLGTYKNVGSTLTKTKGQNTLNYFDNKGIKTQADFKALKIKTKTQSFEIGKGKTNNVYKEQLLKDNIDYSAGSSTSEYKYIQNRQKAFLEGETFTADRISKTSLTFTEYIKQLKSKPQLSNINPLKTYGTSKVKTVQTQVQKPVTVIELVSENINSQLPKILPPKTVNLKSPVIVKTVSTEKPIQLVQSKTLTTTKTEDLLKPTTTSSPKIITIPKTETKNILEQKTILTKVFEPSTISKKSNRNVQITEQKQQLEQISFTEQKQQLEQVQQARTEQKLNQAFQFNTRTVTPKPKLELPIFKIPTPSKAAQPKKQFGFDVFVKRKGIFEKASTNPLVKSQALEYGAFRVQQEASASFKILPSSKSSVGSFFGGASSFKTNFYESKKASNVFIQKARNRIGTAGEKREITFKGIQASKNKNIFRRR